MTTESSRLRFHASVPFVVLLNSANRRRFNSLVGDGWVDSSLELAWYGRRQRDGKQDHLSIRPRRKKRRILKWPAEIHAHFPIFPARDDNNTQTMAYTPRLERKRAFRVTSTDGVSTKLHSAIERRPSFPARMFQLIFKRRSSTDKTRPKSWSGQPESASAETLVCHTSANSIISSESRSSTSGLTTRDDDSEDKCDASWRQRQTHCVNCERLFFVSLSTLSCGTAGFCSLDCKTTFEYVNHLEEVLAVHMLGASAASLDSSSDEDDYLVEEFDVDQLLTNLT